MAAREFIVDEVNEKRLVSWLTAGIWSREEAALLFLEIDPDRQSGECFSTFSGHGEVQYEYFDDDEPNSKVPCGVDEEGEIFYLTSEQEALRHKAIALIITVV